MKRIISLCAIAIIAGTTPSLAKTWRLNPNPEAHADFTSIADAMADDRVEEGDELLLDPGTYSESAVVRKKNITITGPGYLMSTNTDWHEGQHAQLHEISLQGNCTIQGVRVLFDIHLNNGYNSVIRCQVPYENRGIICYGNFDVITNNYVSKIQAHNNTLITNNIVTDYMISGTDCRVENNTLVGSTKGFSYNLMYGFKNSIIKNNIVINTLEGVNSNNIPYRTQTINFNPDDNNTIINNVLSCPAKYADVNYPNNEYVDASLANTFIDNITGDRYLLRDDSVAKGKATDGGDCGAFGGATPYVLSGLPYGMPHITEAQIPSTPTDGKLNIKLKIATQNE